MYAGSCGKVPEISRSSTGKRCGVKNASDARRRAKRDQWDEDAALSEDPHLLNNNQKLTLNYVKTYLLEYDLGFLCPEVKRIPSFKSGTVHSQTNVELLSVPCLPFATIKVTHNPKFPYFQQHLMGGKNWTEVRCCIFFKHP